MLVRLFDEPSDLRLHTQQLKVIAGNRMTVDTFDRLAPVQSCLTISIEAGDVAEGAISLPKVLKRWI
jgi:hypothetical protein